MTSRTIDEAEVGRWVAQLRDEGEERLRAATALGRLGVRTRGAARTRGSLSRTAPLKGLDAAQLAAVLAALALGDVRARREIIFALGELGDAAADALVKIGGPAAVGALRWGATHDPSQEVRARAVDGLAALALAETAGRARGAVRTRGGVHGAVRTRSVSDEVAGVFAFLREI